jgi:hypothetical protein
VFRWPRIDEPELLARLAVDGQEFDELLRMLAASLPPRVYEPASLKWAIGYPWERPAGSYRLTGDGIKLLADMAADEREAALERYLSGAGGRMPLLAIGSNAAPDTLERKFAHFPDGDDREVLALTGRLHDFDVGAAAQPTMYGSMPATLFPSPGTEVCATVLWVTPNQFTQLTWSELTYRLGGLRTRFDVDLDGTSFAEVLVFVSRFGSFCVDERPVALAAVPASGRTAEALTQKQLLDAAAALAIGPEAKAEALVRAIFEETNEIVARIASTVREASVPFASERWIPFSPG